MILQACVQFRSRLMPGSQEVGEAWEKCLLRYVFTCLYIYIYATPPSDLPFVAFIAWKPPELLNKLNERKGAVYSYATQQSPT